MRMVNKLLKKPKPKRKRSREEYLNDLKIDGFIMTYENAYNKLEKENKNLRKKRVKIILDINMETFTKKQNELLKELLQELIKE